MLSSSTLTRPDFIAANQRGQIPEAQRQGLPGQSRAGQVFGAFIGLVLAAFIVAPLVALWQGGPSSGAFIVLACIGLFLLVVVAPAWARSAVRTYLVRQDLREGRVEQAEGQVVWQRSHYGARFPNQRPWSLSHVDGLEPGRYRFCYLPRSGHLLSAHAQPVFSSEQEPALRQAMAHVFGARPEDLAANRAGQLTARQAARVLISGLSAGLFAIGLGGLGLLCVFSDFGNLAERLCAVILAFLVFGLGAFFLSVAARQLLQDALGGKVRGAEGVVTKIRTGGRSPSFNFHVNGQQLQVGYRHYSALFPGHHCRVNYTPRSKYVVSVEVLD